MMPTYLTMGLRSLEKPTKKTCFSTSEIKRFSTKLELQQQVYSLLSFKTNLYFSTRQSGNGCERFNITDAKFDIPSKCLKLLFVLPFRSESHFHLPVFDIFLAFLLPHSVLPLAKKNMCNYLSRQQEIQKQPARGVLKKMCSENMQQIYRRTPMRTLKWPSTSFSPITSTNVGISPQNFLTSSFNLFATFV